MTALSIANRLGGVKVLGRTVSSDFDFFDLVAAGVPKATIKHLADSLGIEVSELIKFLPVTSRNLQRYQDTDLLNTVVSDHLIALAKLFAYGEDALGKDYFRDWLQGPILALGYVKPIDFLKSHAGIEIIRRELGRIEHGIFA